MILKTHTIAVRGHKTEKKVPLAFDTYTERDNNKSKNDAVLATFAQPDISDEKMSEILYRNNRKMISKYTTGRAETSEEVVRAFAAKPLANDST